MEYITLRKCEDNTIWVTSDDDQNGTESKVKPLLCFFSPSIYTAEVTMKNFRNGLREGLGLEDDDV